MIFPRKTLIAVTILLSTIVFSYFARVAIVKSFFKDELALYQANISCLDFRLTTSLELSVNKLCLLTPQAEINIQDMTIEFHPTAEQKIKRIDIASVTIKGTTALFNQRKNSPKNNNSAAIVKQLDSYLTHLAQMNLPFNINVAELRYSPFLLASNKKSNNADVTKTGDYLGQFSVVQNTMRFSLKDFQQNVFLSLKLSTNKGKKSPLTINFSGQLTPLKHFLFKHKLALTPAMLNTLARIELSGSFHNRINYQAGQLTLVSQLNDFSFSAVQGVKESGPFELSGALNIHAKVDLNKDNQAINNYGQIDIEFQQNNVLQLEYSQQHIIDYLRENALSPELITLLIDNPLEQLALRPKGKLTYNLSNQQLSLSSIAISAESDLHIHQLNLANITLDFKHFMASGRTHTMTLAAKNKPKSVNYISRTDEHRNESALLVQFDFKLDSKLLLSTLNNFTQLPVEFKLQGFITQSHQQTTIHFDQNSSFTSDNIAHSAEQKTSDKKFFTVKQLKTRIHGDVQFLNKKTIFLNLTTDSQAKKIRIDKIIELKNFTISSKISGDVSNIKINASATADHIPLGDIAITGALAQPNITLSAKALPLTELLSLNIKLPTKIDLVEGTLSYSIKAQATDLTNLQNTPFVISVEIMSASGEVAGIWLQELNWQQDFNFLAGTLTSLDNADLTLSGHSKDNLTVALIDTATPISKLSITTSWHYQKDFKVSVTQLKGNILGGSFSIPKIQWPLEHGHSVDVQLTSIDLEQVLALDKKQGIVVTGKISGQLPINYDGKKYTMAKGELHNVGNGLIQVINNPAVQELKASNSQLQLAFDALQNLHYHQLSSDVSMADDGYMLLETVIKGRNPDINNDVNLNLNLSYDLLGLLESLSITEQFEKRIVNGLQKNKE